MGPTSMYDTDQCSRLHLFYCRIGEDMETALHPTPTSGKMSLPSLRLALSSSYAEPCICASAWFRASTGKLAAERWKAFLARIITRSQSWQKFKGGRFLVWPMGCLTCWKLSGWFKGPAAKPPRLAGHHAGQHGGDGRVIRLDALLLHQLKGGPGLVILLGTEAAAHQTGVVDHLGHTASPFNLPRPGCSFPLDCLFLERRPLFKKCLTVECLM